MKINEIELKKFDKKYYNSLKDKSKIKIEKNGIYYTIIFKNKKIGIVGIILIIKNRLKKGFIQILIDQNFRGIGILKIAEEKCAKLNKINTLYATIKIKNIISIKAHKKIGFRKITKKREEYLKKNNYLKNDEIRLVKSVK
jgi:RimJ/RimL family protein N-acetyltransferase